ncbi:ABC transporter permease subunit [Mycetocola lacteus]|uniref:ABC transporter permease subunit n=1 Tax=Mycetocola lacteus TaxID=76637 RepID=A0A3L7ALI6_9MICO|nr:ABC transporter permease [Mycetocola lacteus]RLP80815.1 ABC transporter permease subunit [Mycetocola lacteus]RLP84600.1 ABC transporter permease subunit [Mycetocola lacteus]
MASYILRRIFVSILILIAASFIMYILTAGSGDPLQDLRGSSAPNKEQLIQARIAALNLNDPVPVRWLMWLGGAAGCVVPFANLCNLGVNLSNAPVTTLLPDAMFSTIQMVTLAFILALVVGIVVGIVTALRQHSGFDLSITFLSFFLFSLPSFLVAVLLKEFIAIGYNNFLSNDPRLSVVLIVIISVVSAAIWQVLVGGNAARRLKVFIISGLATAAVLTYMSLTDWFLHPGLGPVGLFVLIAGTAVGVTAIVSGLANRRALIAAGVTGAIVYISYFFLQGLFNISSAATLVIIFLVMIVVGLIIGFFTGGPDKGQAMRAAAITAGLGFLFVILDRFMAAWPAYMNNPRINGRPIATVGANTPGLTGDVWITGLDSFTHLLLPTISLLLISFAGYTRYARAGLLEVFNQDYIRTARAKGLPERTVVVRHAFRNMLIPIATLVAADIGALLGGAIITEQVFAISGMGRLFSTSLARVDVNPVMGYFVVIAIMAIAFNFIADLAYAALDPRVRVR